MSDEDGTDERDLRRNELLKLLTRRRIVFPADRQGDARVLAGAQPSAWRQMVGYIIQKIVEDREEKSAFDTMARILLGVVEPLAGHTSISEISSGKGWAVEPRLPIIDPTWVEQNAEYLRQDAWFSLSAVLTEISAQTNFMRTLRSQAGAAMQVYLDPRYIAAAAEVALLRTTNAGAIGQTLADLRQTKAAAERQINNVAAQNSRFEAALAAHDQDWADFRTKKEADIAAIKQQVADSIRLDASHSLWRKRSGAHLWWSFGAFAVMLIGITAVIWVVLEYALDAIKPTFFEIITKSGYATQKLILISLCVIGAAWALRFVARVIVENMSLRADAQHRQSMLETYLALRGEVGLKDEERAIILTALFRPLPGQAADENPPTPAGEVLQKFIRG